MSQLRTLLVVPCYNEASRLPRRAFVEHLKSDSSTDFLFVDDGSTDATKDVLLTLAAAEPSRLAVISLDRNHGKAEAVRRGMLAGFENGYQFVGYWDADLATPLEAVPVFLETFVRKPSLECVFGARVKLLGRDIHRRAIRHYAGRVFATAASLTLGLGVYDTQCGAKIFRVVPRVRRIFARPFISRWIFDVELFDRLVTDAGAESDVEAGALLYELPLLHWTDVAGSAVRGRDFVRAAFELIRIRLARRAALAPSREVAPL